MRRTGPITTPTPTWKYRKLRDGEWIEGQSVREEVENDDNEFDEPLEVVEEPATRSVSTSTSSSSTRSTSSASMSAAAAQHVIDVAIAKEKKQREPEVAYVGEKRRRIITPEEQDAEAHALENLLALEKTFPNRKNFLHARTMQFTQNWNCSNISGLQTGVGHDQRIGRVVDWISVHVRGVVEPIYNDEAENEWFYPDRCDMFLLWDKATSAADIGNGSFTGAGSLHYPLDELTMERFEVIAHRVFEMGALARWPFDGAHAGVAFGGAGRPLRAVEFHKSLLGKRTVYKTDDWNLADIESGVLSVS